MKPVVKASIGKTAFTLEEEAYNILKTYLDSLNAHFSGNPSGNEIIDEIETRLAELLTEKCGPYGVASAQAAAEARDTLGSIEDIDSDKPQQGNGSEEQQAHEAAETGKQARKLFRNPEDKILGGVCSGIAAYFGKEPLLFRLIAIGLLLFFAFTVAWEVFWVPVVAYLALWLAIPEAKTVGQRYQMRGDKNTLGSIMENIGKGAEEIGNSAKRFNNDHPDILKTVMRSVSVVVGTVFILISFAALLALGISAAGVSLVFPISPYALISSATGAEYAGICTAALLVSLGIPFISILYCGILMTFNISAPRWRPGLLLLLLWIAGIGVLGYFGARTAMYVSSGERQYTAMSVNPDTEQLRIEMEGAQMDYDYIYLNADEDKYELVLIRDNELYAFPEITLKRNPAADSIEVKESTVFFKGINRTPSFCSYSDGVLTLSPIVFSRHGRIEEAGREITISLPVSAKVMVEGPESHDFSGEQHHTNIAMLKKCCLTQEP